MCVAELVAYSTECLPKICEKEKMITSDYISDNNAFDEKVFIGDMGATSLSYRVGIDGKQYFMKQLRSEFFPNKSNRDLFYKEYELGKK